jgi:hypothetical protein
VRRFLTIDEYAALAPRERDGDIAIIASSNQTPTFGSGGDRKVRYVFSTPAVGRDLHTVAADAWQITNFLRNPVFLWAHSDTLPPIGRVIEIGDIGGKLKGTVEYAERDLNPFAHTVYQLVRAGYLAAVSTAWIPIEGTMSRDKSRPKGVDFSKVELLEVSQVPVPALPTALAEARSCGIDTAPIKKWASATLDARCFGALSRSEVAAIYRAAGRPAATYVGAGGGDPGRLRRRATALRFIEAGRPSDRKLLAEYRNERNFTGLTHGRIAFDWGVHPEKLAATIARLEQLEREGAL